MLNKKLLKKCLAVTLSLAMCLSMANYGTVVGTASKGAVNVLAEELIEPAYDVATDNVLYYADSVTDSVSPNVTLAKGEKFYFSFNVKAQSATQVWINLGEGDKGGARILLDENRHAILNAGTEDEWNGANPGITTEAGANVTVISDGQTVSIWINHTLVKENAVVSNQSETSAPTCTGTDAVFSNVLIWKTSSSEEPKCDAEADTLLKKSESEVLDANTNYILASSIPTGKAYGMTFGVKTQGQMWICYGDQSDDRLLIQASQYHTTGLVNNKEWIQFKPKRYFGSVSEKITLWVENNALSVWVNGTKIIDNEKIANTDLSGILKVYFQQEATLSNVQAWYQGKPPVVETDEPKYDASKNILLCEQDVVNVTNGTAYEFENSYVSEKDTYYITYNLKTQGDSYFTYRGTKTAEQGQVFIGKTQYGLVGLENEKWPQVPGLASATDGVRITIISTPEASTIYVNGEKVADNEPLKVKGGSGKASIYVTGDDAVVENVKIWALSDMPVYDETTDISKFYMDQIDIPAQTKSDFGIKVPGVTEYYATFEVKSEGGIFFLLRGEIDECRLYMDDHQYALLGIAETENWPQKQTGLKDGAIITIACSGDSVRIWLNGEKIADETFTQNIGLKGCPGLSWVNADTTVKNVRVWLKGDAILTDEPKYDETNNVLKVSKEELSVAAESKDTSFGVEIPSYQEYFMDFTVKSDAGIFISYRGGDVGRLYIDENQYAIIGINENTEWVQRETNLSEGVRVTIQSSGKKISIWLDGDSIVKDADLLSVGEVGTPSVSWAKANATITNLKVWTNQDEYTAEFNWASNYETATITIVNAKDEKDTYTFDAVVTKEEKFKPTCTVKGMTTYTAKYGGYTETKDVETDAKGHNYKTEFKWAADNKSAKVVVTCLNDATDVKTYDAKVVAAVTTKATYFAKGITTYTATYNNYKETRKVSNIPQLKLGNSKVTVKSPKKKQLKISLKRVTGATNYEIQYSLNKSFKGAKKVTTKKLTYTLKKMKSKKKYYVRVRAVVTSGKKKAYGAWVKTKKAIKVK